MEDGRYGPKHCRKTLDEVDYVGRITYYKIQLLGLGCSLVELVPEDFTSPPRKTLRRN